MLNALVLHPRTKILAEKLELHLPHGLVIDGPIGSGVLAVAKAMATSVGSLEIIICPKKKVKGEYIIDLHEGNVIIQDIRKLYEQTRTGQPNEQVYIIDTGDKSMTLGAQNAFLKLLEEPRSGIHFIIATHQYDQLLPTIVSRTQRLSLTPITDEQADNMIDSLGITDSVKKVRLSFVGRGRPALIKRLASDEKTYDSRVAIMSDAKTMLGNDAYQKMLIIHNYRDNRANALTLIDDMNHQVQTILRTQPKQQLVADIERYLSARHKIAAGGNIKLHLAAAVL